MNFLRKVSFALPIAAAICVQIIMALWYWLVEPIVTIFWLYPLLVLFFLSAVFSVVAILIRRGPGRWIPSSLLAFSVIAAYNIPYTNYSMHVDFRMKYAQISAVALAAQNAPLPYEVLGAYELDDGAGQFTEYALPADKRWLAKTGIVFTSDAECGRFVLFPTFFGIPDGVEGFLYSPKCVAADAFPGDRFGVKWRNINVLGNSWFRIGGS